MKEQGEKRGREGKEYCQIRAGAYLSLKKPILKVNFKFTNLG